MASVTLNNVNKIYGSRKGPVHAVQNMNLEIKDGEFVALLGPSGCGKTSTLRMIVGLEEISSGTIHFDDQVVNDLTPEKRNVAMAFETYALYPNFTVAENLGFPLEVRGIPESERRQKVQEIARLLRITDLLEQRPGQLSGGQQQRVSLGRALIRDPAVFILDEVMSHLDAHLKFQMLFELKRIHQSLGKTMIYVTHDQMEALALSDRVAVMANSILQQFGDRNDLYHRPANRFVADFIGEPATNFFEAEIREVSGSLSLQVNESLAFEMDARRQQAVRESGVQRAIVGLRPQYIGLEPLEGGGSVQTELLVNEYLGERSILDVQAGSALFRALAPPETSASRGERMTLHYHPGNVMVFHPESEVFLG
ncbi:MAG: ABC transporter ATP-binding protein [bacterium]